MDKPISLSKSKFLSGWQCRLRLWYDIHRPELAPPVSDDLQAVFDLGHEVGRIAHKLYPGGIEVIEPYDQHRQAIETTKTLMADKSVKAIFEAAFEFEDTKIRADILERTRGGWNLVEVKSSGEVKEIYKYDAAFQYYVLKGCGVELKKAGLCHINKEYIYDGVDLNPEGFLINGDLTADCVALQEEVRTLVSDFRQMLASDIPPEAKAPYSCTGPYECPYSEHCLSDRDEYWIYGCLPRFRVDRLKRLEERGIVNVHDLPDDERLSEMQERVRKAIVSGNEFIDPDLKDKLNGLNYPVYFLDFETFFTAIPRYKGTRPFQVLPFQWSCHILHGDGRLEHREYLCIEDKDPRPEFIETMLECLGETGTIAMYHHYERDRIKQLAEELPIYRERLNALLPRLWDLLVVIRENYYHPGFKKSFSLKSVLPAVIPEMTYEGMEIGNGGDASAGYELMVCSQLPDEEKARIRAALLKYCKQDTFAMVRLREELLQRGKML